MSVEQRKAVYLVQGQKIIYSKKDSYSGSLLTNTLGVYEFEFRTDSEWTEFDKVALYLQATGVQPIYIELTDTNIATCTTGADGNKIYKVPVPEQMLTKAGQLTVGLIGYYSNQDDFRFPTNTDSSYRIAASVQPLDGKQYPQYISIMEQILLRLYKGQGGSTEDLTELRRQVEQLNQLLKQDGDGTQFLSNDGKYHMVTVATTDAAGIVKPDGTSITVDEDGTIHAETTIKKKKPLTLHSKTKYFKGKNVLTGNVGSKISLVSNAYRDCYKVPISEDKSYIITLVRTTTATTSQAWIVTDASDNILAIGPQENVESSAFIPKIPNAAYLYFSTVGDRIVTIYEYVENSDGVIYEGDKYKFTNSDITANSCTVTSYNGASNLKFTATGGSATIQLPQDTRSSSVGIWVKLNTSEIKNLTQLNFSFKDGGTTIVTQQAGKAVLSSGGWHFIKVATYDGKINQLEISANFTSSFINVQIMNEVLFNQYTMPSIILDFDRTWKASEDCGLYDYLLNNKIPFTITGALSDITENMKSKLLEAYNTGLVDLGLYGNELYDGVSNPVSYQSTDYNELQQNLGKLLNKKLEYCEMPVSFGPMQHEFSNMLIDFISRNGFKVTKVPNTLGAISNAMFKDGQIICIAMKGSYTSDIQHDMLHKGDSIGIFAHGVSANPSTESEPSLYADWETAKAELNAYVSMRNKGLLRFENMKQVAERNGR